MSTINGATSVKGPLGGFGTDAANQAATAAQTAPGAADAAASAAVSGQAGSQPAAVAGDAVGGFVSTLGQTEGLFSWGGYFQALAFLFLIVAILFAALWLLKRRGGIKFLTGQGDLAIESRMTVGPKKSLLVVRFLNKRVLLGVTDQRITMLTELPINEEDTPQHGPETANAADFAGHLAKAGNAASEDSG